MCIVQLCRVCSQRYYTSGPWLKRKYPFFFCLLSNQKCFLSLFFDQGWHWPTLANVVVLIKHDDMDCSKEWQNLDKTKFFPNLWTYITYLSNEGNDRHISTYGSVATLLSGRHVPPPHPCAICRLSQSKLFLFNSFHILSQLKYVLATLPSHQPA